MSRDTVGRRADDRWRDVESGFLNGAYAKVPEDALMYRTGARWVVSYGSVGTIRAGMHVVTEHEDGTITVEPSLVMPPMGNGERWHGFLRRGIFTGGFERA